MFLVINDLNGKLNQDILTILPEESKIFSKDTHPIKSCVGCFGCWTKTPGICVIDDASREISAEIMKSSVLLIITKITYGCYSPYIKKIMDRNIPNLLPFFKKLNNEIHHAPRYDKYPKIIAVGYGNNVTPQEEETFKKLVEANSVNLQKTKFKSYIIKDLDELKTLIPSIVRSDLNE